MLPRHSLVWLNQAGWEDAERSVAPGCREALSSWRRDGLPLIARRHEPDLDVSQCCLGIALPPDPATGHKTRIPVRVRRTNLQKHIAPLPLACVLPAARPSWRKTLRELDEHARATGIELRAYGSLALQLITRKTYLTEASDIDLLLVPSSRSQLQAGLALLAAYGREVPLDGEIVFPDLQAVAWKEWLQCSRAPTGTRVLAKGQREVALRKPAELLSMLEDARCVPCP